MYIYRIIVDVYNQGYGITMWCLVGRDTNGLLSPHEPPKEKGTDLKQSPKCAFLQYLP